MDFHVVLDGDEEVVMQPYAVKVPVISSVPIECTFRPEDDGWKGACVELAVAVPGSNFEEAKKNMEKALQEYIIAILRGRGAKLAA